MIISTTDPISLKDVPDPEKHPYVLEGKGETTLKIYFESEENKATYLGVAFEHPGKEFEANLDISV